MTLSIQLSGNSPLKILTTGDNHLGKKQYKNKTRKKDYMDSFQEVIDIAIQRDFDAIVNKGDLFDDPQPDVKTVKDTIDTLKRLEEADIPFFAIVGNHERKQETQWIELIDGLSNIYRLTQTPTVLENDSYALALYGIDAVRKYQWSKKDLSLKPVGEEYKDIPKIAVMHELISPPINEGIHDYNLEDVLHRLQLEIDVLGLSDYHKPIETTFEDTLVYYSGSTEKTKYNEQETHSVVVLTVDDEIHKNRIELQSPRTFRIKELQLNEETTFSDIQTELDNIALKESPKDPVVVIKLQGKNNIIETTRIIDYITDRGALLTNIIDNRVSEQIDLQADIEDQDISDIENTIDSEISEMDLSEQTQEVNSIVRNIEISDSNVRDEVADLIGDTQ